jgi:muramidase (phage lysozyme)
MPAACSLSVPAFARKSRGTGTGGFSRQATGSRLPQRSRPGHMITVSDYSKHSRIRNDMGTPNNPNDDSDAAGRYQFI